MTVTKRMVQDIRVQLGKRIRWLLGAKGIKHRFVSNKIEVTPAYFSKILSGQETPSDKAICKIAEILNLTPHELLHGVTYSNNLADYLGNSESEG